MAAPISVSFGVEPEDRAAIEKLVTLTSDPAVEGAWAWIKHDDGRWAMDYRTKDYWPAGTRVHVEAKLYGRQAQRHVLRRVGSDQRLHHRPQSGRRRRRELARAGGQTERRGRRLATRPPSGAASDNGDPEPDHPVGDPCGHREGAGPYLMNNPRYGYSNSLSAGPSGSATTANSSTPTRPAPAPGQHQRHPRLREPVTGRRRGLLPLRDLGRPGRGQPAPPSTRPGRTATSTSGRMSVGRIRKALYGAVNRVARVPIRWRSPDRRRDAWCHAERVLPDAEIAFSPATGLISYLGPVRGPAGAGDLDGGRSDRRARPDQRAHPRRDQSAARSQRRRAAAAVAGAHPGVRGADDPRGHPGRAAAVDGRDDPIRHHRFPGHVPVGQRAAGRCRRRPGCGCRRRPRCSGTTPSRYPRASPQTGAQVLDQTPDLAAEFAGDEPDRRRATARTPRTAAGPS